jgi:hypothetical protein
MESSRQGNSCPVYKPLLLAALLIFGLVQNANAYVDPNSAGPLFQMLFPLFVAVASMFALLRRMIKRAWNRLTSVFLPGARAGSFDVNTNDESP